MAKKVRCPQCGAKNAADLPRCRICGTVIQAEEAIGYRVMAEANAEADALAHAAGDSPEGVPTVVLKEVPDSGGGIVYDPQPLTASVEFLTIDPEAEYDVEVEQPELIELPDAPTRDNPVIAEEVHFELEEIDVNLHIYQKPPGVPVLSDEEFDPDDLTVEKKEIPPPIEVEPNAHFDFEGLEVGVPRDPRPSS